MSILTLPRPERAFFGAALVALMAGGSALSESARLSLAQADALAAQALAAGESRLAYDLSKGLLEAGKDNPRAHYYQALALAQARAFGPAERKAALAYWHSNTEEQRYQAANLAAQLSFADERLTGSQFWLRRAVDHAPDEVARARTVSAFQNVRARNPLRFDLRVSTAPSDNVNNGSNSPLNVIDGVPVVGNLSPSARALSGVITKAHGSLSYRIAQSEGRETRLRGRVTARRVDISDRVVGLSGDDLSSTLVELGVTQYLRGSRETVTWKFDLDGGRVWYGGDPLYDFARLGVARYQRLDERFLLSFGGSLEEQQDEAARGADSTISGAFAGIGMSLEGGGRVGFRLQYRDADSSGVNRTSDQWTGIATYALGRELGPASLEFSLGVSRLDYGRYQVGFINVPGGRDDESVFGGVTATFNDWGYMGFVPTLTVTSERSRSNISRFDVEETSVSLGIRSEF
ncbi:hypothetical protein [uncultured Roseovarius sp.]|uniref:hypothetical protein n=1 Tax=uncultured Roseovarius sp. TaxID=293344 RepID=UPI00262FC615|nr:hypothetical protein [uncultured Roseovarius sp.]